MKDVKRILCLIISAAVLVGALAGCSNAVNGDGEKESASATVTETTTTTTTTKPTTTENLKTTFPATPTRVIYPGLKKDKKGEYPHKLAEYYTNYNPGNVSRTENLRNAAEKINKIVVPDGETFSFNQVVGKRTVTAGYVEASVIQDGEFVDGLGGGVCQVSSTIFEAVLRANCKIVERAGHSLEVTYVPLGGDATVNWNSCDFRFKNTTGSDIRLTMTCNGGRLTCSVWSKDSVDVGDVQISITKSGKTYTLTRTVNGEQNYRTSSKYKKPKPKETTTKKKKKDKDKDKKKDKETSKKKDKEKEDDDD